MKDDRDFYREYREAHGEDYFEVPQPGVVVIGVMLFVSGLLIGAALALWVTI